MCTEDELSTVHAQAERARGPAPCRRSCSDRCRRLWRSSAPRGHLAQPDNALKRSPTSRSSARLSVLDALRRIRAIGVIPLYSNLFLGILFTAALRRLVRLEFHNSSPPTFATAQRRSQVAVRVEAWRC